MANTQDTAGVGTAVMLESAQALCVKASAMIVARRRKEYVGAAMNGAPAPCSDPLAATTRSEHQREGGYSPIARQLMLDVCDMADGVPLSLVLQPRLLQVDWLRAHACAPCTDRPLSAITVRETKAQARLDLAQFRLAEQPNDPTVIREALAAADYYAQPLDELRATLRHKLTLHAGETTPARRFVGQRRRPLALHS